MFLFTSQVLETTKYQDLVKLAKEHNVYRRYASKAELIEKLSSIKDENLETLDDISMPSVMEDGGDLDLNEHDIKQHEAQKSIHLTPATTEKSSRASRTQKVERKPLTPAKPRRSLAGPARHSGVQSRDSCKSAESFVLDLGKDVKTSNASSHTMKRFTRQRTFDITTPDLGKNKESQKASPRKSLKRESTYSVEKPSRKMAPQLRRQGTFDVETDKNHLTTPKESGQSLRVSKVGIQQSTQEAKNGGTPLPRTPLVKRTSLVTLQSSGMSATRNFVSRRMKIGTVVAAKSPVSKIPTKTKVNSVIQDIHHKTAAASLLKESSANKMNIRHRKAPDFEAIHSKLFDKMESLVDSRQKVIDRANSVQKKIPKCAVQPAAAARKLLSPKYGISRMPSPKPVPKSTAGLIRGAKLHENKRLSISKMVTGISRLSSPGLNSRRSSGVSQKTKTLPQATSSNRFGFNPLAPNRREIFKDVINHKAPTKKSDTTQKSRQMLQTVRLNKRFELQMKHRLNQQKAQTNA